MQTFPLSKYSDDFTSEGYDKLSISLKRIVKGNDNVLLTPQAKRAGPDNIYEAWNRIFTANYSLMNDELLDIEISNRDKFGPRSIALPWAEYRNNTKRGFEIPSVDTSHLDSRPLRTGDMGKLRPLSATNSAMLTKSNTQAGAPTLAKKGRVREETLDNFVKLYGADLVMIPAIRTQEQRKTRIVKIYPYVDIIQENRYFVPLFNYYRNLECFAAMLGPDAVDTAMTSLITQAVELDQLCVSGDISGFDDSCGIDLQGSSFTRMKSLFQSSYHDEFDEIAYRFGHKPFVTPEGVWVGPHGIPSGSNFTNLIGSDINQNVCGCSTMLSQFLGDDFATVTGSPNEVFSRYKSVGLDLNEQKTLVKPNSFVYLQKLFHPDYEVKGEFRGIYPCWRALNRLIYPERYSDFNEYGLNGKDYFAIRSLSILENCKYHPLFEKFVKFWMSYEKYSVPTNSSIAAYVKMQEEKIGSLGTTNQYGDKTSGIRDFASYRIASKFV